MAKEKNGKICVRKQKKHHFKFKLKDVYLLITTFVAIATPIISCYEIKINNMRYENELSQLELEKEKYQNILKENETQIRDSYIICNVNYIEDLFNNLGDGNVKILSNNLTKIFYDSKQRKYLEATEIGDKFYELKNQYDFVYTEVIFLKIEIIGNRQISNVFINFDKIEEENYIEGIFTRFSNFEDEDFKNLDISLGKLAPNDIILVPVVLQYSEGQTERWEKIEENNEKMHQPLLYKEIYIPRSITFYDVFYEKEITLEIRDALEDSLITCFYFQELG